LNVGTVKSDHGVAVQAQALDDLLHGLFAHEYGTRVAERALMLFNVRFPLGLEVTGAAVIRLLVAVNDQVTPQISQVAGYVGTLLTAERMMGFDGSSGSRRFGNSAGGRYFGL
jgi:hypothetical protein